MSLKTWHSSVIINDISLLGIWIAVQPNLCFEWFSSHPLWPPNGDTSTCRSTWQHAWWAVLISQKPKTWKLYEKFRAPATTSKSSVKCALWALSLAANLYAWSPMFVESIARWQEWARINGRAISWLNGKLCEFQQCEIYGDRALHRECRLSKSAYRFFIQHRMYFWVL